MKNDVRTAIAVALVFCSLGAQLACHAQSSAIDTGKVNPPTRADFAAQAGAPIELLTLARPTSRLIRLPGCCFPRGYTEYSRRSVCRY